MTKELQLMDAACFAVGYLVAIDGPKNHIALMLARALKANGVVSSYIDELLADEQESDTQ